MEEKMKTRVMIALGVLSAILLIVSVNSCNGVRARDQKWRKEMAQRLDAEEKAQKAGQEQSALSGELAKTKESLQQTAKELDNTKKSLVQEQMVNKNLKAELEKLSKLKDALEADLKEALMNGGRKQQKK